MSGQFNALTDSLTPHLYASPVEMYVRRWGLSLCGIKGSFALPGCVRQGRWVISSSGPLWWRSLKKFLVWIRGVLGALPFACCFHSFPCSVLLCSHGIARATLRGSLVSRENHLWGHRQDKWFESLEASRKLFWSCNIMYVHRICSVKSESHTIGFKDRSIKMHTH